MGNSALQNNSCGVANTAIGDRALLGRPFAVPDFNTAVGAEALTNNNTGGLNNAVGFQALHSNDSGANNTAVGVLGLGSNLSGNFNVALGNNAGQNVTTADNVICVGANVAGANVDNSCYIGSIFGQTSSGGAAVFINSNGQLGTLTSSRRFKEGIKPTDHASEALFALKPVTFRYKKEIDSVRASQFGLVAEEVEKVNPNLVVRDNEGRPYSVRYDQVNAMLLNEFLKEHRKVEQLEKQIQALTAGLQKVSAQLEAGKPAPQVVNNP
jgi:hypothetical protein